MEALRFCRAYFHWEACSCLQLGQERADHCSCIHAMRRLMPFPASCLSYSYCGQPFAVHHPRCGVVIMSRARFASLSAIQNDVHPGRVDTGGTCVLRAGHQRKEGEQPCVALILLSRKHLLQHDLKAMCQESCSACSQGSSMQIRKGIHLPHEAISIFMF